MHALNIVLFVNNTNIRRDKVIQNIQYFIHTHTNIDYSSPNVCLRFDCPAVEKHKSDASTKYNQLKCDNRTNSTQIIVAFWSSTVNPKLRSVLLLHGIL